LTWPYLTCVHSFLCFHTSMMTWQCGISLNFGYHQTMTRKLSHPCSERKSLWLVSFHRQVPVVMVELLVKWKLVSCSMFVVVEVFVFEWHWTSIDENSLSLSLRASWWIALDVCVSAISRPIFDTRQNPACCIRIDSEVIHWFCRMSDKYFPVHIVLSFCSCVCLSEVMTIFFPRKIDHGSTATSCSKPGRRSLLIW